MKTPKILLLLFILFTILPDCLANRLEDLKFNQFSTFNGLPNNMVHEVYQDRDGFIWIATFYGLFRYDGYEVKTIKSNLYTPGLLVNNNVICIQEDHGNQLWIGTHEGVCILDKRTGYIRKMKLEGVKRQRVNKIHVTQDNQVYLGYIRGMARYDAESDSLILLTQQNAHGEVPGQVNIQAITEDENGDLLIGTWNDGLFRYNIRENLFFHYSELKEINSIQSLFRDSGGAIWIGSSGNGLFKTTFAADKKTISATGYNHIPHDPRSLCSDYIYSIAEDHYTQSLWLGTRSGVSIMSLDREGYFINYQDSGNRNHLPVHEVNSVIRDKNGLMWIGTKGAGVFHVDTHARSFQTFHSHNSHPLFTDFISALYVDKDEAIWAGFGYGVDYYKGDQTINVLSSERPYHITYSRSTDEIILSAHDEGIITCREGKRIHQYRTKNCRFIPHDLVYMVHEDRKGNWWIGSYMGLGVRYRDGREYCMNRLEGVDELLSGEVTCITEGENGTLWLGTNNNGIVHVTGNIENPHSLLCKNYCMENGTLPVNTPLCFLPDTQGRVWAGTEGSGLCLYDKATDSFISVHQQYNLPGDMVGSIEEDEQGNLWIGTNQGLARLAFNDKGEYRIRIFTVADGLADNFFNKNASSYRNGRLYFGCSRGIVHFNADIAKENTRDIALRITEILIDGKPLDQLPGKQLEKITPFTADFTNELTIPAAFNNFTLRFASLTYNMPGQNQYAHRLLPYDPEWHYTGADNRNAYYSNLPPGKYTFELRATNENGDWGDIRSLQVVVHPPFWATWWAYLVYATLILGSALLMLREARRRLLLRNQLHLQEMETTKIQELNHIKLQFFTNITHELMTPLTIISATLDELKQQLPTFDELYNTMDANVQRLIRLLQQILEFRKAESGNLQLRVSKGDIALFIRHEAESFEPLIRKQQLHFSLICEEEIMQAYFDRDKLDKILYNLLSNAAKYNRKEGFIQLSVKYSENKDFVKISVRDNGKGISPERQKRLFERFYEGDHRQSHTIGTGIGLSLTRDLVLLHRGTIRVESEMDKGTQFLVELPVKQEAYLEEEMIEVTEISTVKDPIADQSVFEDTEAAIRQPDPSAPCILLAEDNEELLSVMVRLLGREYHVLKARDGFEALEIIKEKEVDLIVSDVVMPGINGIELTKKIKSDLEMCHIPVVLLTAKSAEEDRDEGYLAGADAYLTKPFNLAMLHARIRNLLKNKERIANDFKKQLAFEIKELDYTDMDEKFLQDAINCVNRHLNDTDFDIPRFTSEMATSRTTLHKKLKSLTGLNATGFIRNVRLKAACKLMDENKNIRISDLAYTVGFNDPKYFSICFKKEFGIQPTEYIDKYITNL